MKQLHNIPEPSLRRLVRYYDLLKEIDTDYNATVSSSWIAEQLGIESIQVRKDVQYTGIIGKPKSGYCIGELKLAIETTMNWNNYHEAILVGVGKLGKSLLMYDSFKNYGLSFAVAFDNSPDEVNTEINGIKILHIDKMSNLVKRMHIHIGVLTVPANVAQAITDMMVEGGVKAIWNFASYQIKVPKDVNVVHAQFSQSLALLTSKLPV